MTEPGSWKLREVDYSLINQTGIILSVFMCFNFITEYVFKNFPNEYPYLLGKNAPKKGKAKGEVAGVKKKHRWRYFPLIL